MERKINIDFLWPLIGSIILWVLIGIVSKDVSFNQILGSAMLASFSLLLSLGQMIVVTSGGGSIDLSLIYIMTLCAYISTGLSEYGLILSVVVALLIGAFCGIINGLCIVKLRIPAMIATLSTGYIIFSLVLLIAPKFNSLPHRYLVKFVNTNIFGISTLILISIIIAIIVAILMYKTKYGKNLHAVGQNKMVAYYAGIATEKVVIVAFILAGLLAASSGILCGAFIGGAFQDMGSTYFLPSVAATFIGGTLASGGKSNVLGVCFGALMMSLLGSFLNIAGFSVGMQRLIQGLFLVIILIVSVTDSKILPKNKSKQ